jgi:hypothetical protein
MLDTCGERFILAAEEYCMTACVVGGIQLKLSLLGTISKAYANTKEEEHEDPLLSALAGGRTRHADLLLGSGGHEPGSGRRRVREVAARAVLGAVHGLLPFLSRR